MANNRSAPNAVNMALQGGQFGWQHHPDNNSQSLDIISRIASGKGSLSGKHTNQFHLAPGYSYALSQHPFPGALRFNHHVPDYIPQCLHLSARAREGCQCYKLPWQRYEIPQRGWGRPQLFHSPEAKGKWPLFPDACQVAPALPEHNSVIQLTSPSLTPPGHPSSAPGRPPQCLSMNKLQPTAELPKSVLQALQTSPH